MSKQGRINKRRNFTSMLGTAANRSEESLNTIKTFLIITEGVQTEVKYFKSFPLYNGSRIMQVIGAGSNTLSLVEFAKNKLQDFKDKNHEIFDEVWLVFDKDSFPDDHFDNAIRSAQSNGFKVAYSNESFELWFLLHFKYMTSQISREQCIELLNEHLNSEYHKNSDDMYEKLLPYQELAIQRANQLKSVHGVMPPHETNPITFVVDLVEELNRNSRNRF